MSDFKFDLNARRVRYLNKDLINSLKTYAKIKNYKYFTTAEYNKWEEKIATSETFTKRFGSWHKALKLIGILGGHEKEYTPEELIKNLENIWKELKFPPGKRRLVKYGEKISEQPYKRIWGSVRAACEQIDRFYKRKITRNQLLLKSNSPKERKTISLRTRYDVLRRDNYKCRKCGRSPATNHSITLEIDHIIPIAKHGTNDIDNLQTLCSDCNEGKKDRD